MYFYLWGTNDKLLSIVSNGKETRFEYDGWGNLSKTLFENGKTELRNPDKTGQVYYGYSGVRPQKTHPTMQKQMPKESKVSKRPPNNCAEFDAVNKAMLDGAGSMDNIDVYTVKTSTGEAMTRCNNCQHSTRGTHTHSEVI